MLKKFSKIIFAALIIFSQPSYAAPSSKGELKSGKSHKNQENSQDKIAQNQEIQALKSKDVEPIKITLADDIVLTEYVPKRHEKDRKGIFTYVLENDKFAGTDRGYTNGMRFSYTTSQDSMPSFVQKAASYLPLLTRNGAKRINIAIGQSMFTPNDTYASQPIPNDRPYAGWAYGSLGLISDTEKILDVAVLTIGIVGPSAQGKNAQNEVHKAMGVEESHGWKNQLKDELGVNFTYERKWRNIFEASPFGFAIDAIPHLGINLGNVDTSAAAGVTVRLGYDLPSDYGPPRIRPSLPGSDFFVPSKQITGYLFSTLSGSYVVRNIFLDGNSFRSGPSVEKRDLVGSLQVGVSAAYKDIRISYANVLLTEEYVGEQGNVKFGVFTVSYRF